MPQFFVEAPEGIRDDAKRTMMQDINRRHRRGLPTFLTCESGCGNTRPTNVAQDGRVGAEAIRPVCFSRGTGTVQHRRPSARWPNKILIAVGQAYDGLANTAETLILMNHYPLENAGFAGRLQSDDPQLVEAMKQLNR